MHKLLTLALITTTACGALFNDTVVPLTIVAPADAKLTLDGMPVNAGVIGVSAHKSHVVLAQNPDGSYFGRCEINTHIKTSYIIGDVVLFASVLPLVIDAVTSDWSVLDTDKCVFYSK